MPDLETQLRRYGDALTDQVRPVTAAEARTARAGRRPSWLRRRMPILVAAGVVGLAVVLAVVLLQPAAAHRTSVATDGGAGPSTTVATSATTAATTATSASVAPASGITIGPTATAPTCAQASAGNDIGRLLTAFRAARIRGHGAEDCLTPAALAAYCGPAHACTADDFLKSPGPIALYSWQGNQLTDLVFQGTDVSNDGITHVLLEEHFAPARTADRGGWAPATQNEDVVFGSGIAAGSRRRAHLLIVDASTGM